MIRTAVVCVIASLAAGIVGALAYEPTTGTDDTFTAADLETLLASLDPFVVADAVDGFGTASVQEADGCRRIRFAMASTMDNLELNEALSLWAESHPPSKVEAADGKSVTLLQCGTG